MIENQNIRPAQVIGPLGESLTIESLPHPTTTRWVVRRKAEVVPVNAPAERDEACERTAIRLEEFAGWQRAVGRRLRAGGLSHPTHITAPSTSAAGILGPGLPAPACPETVGRADSPRGGLRNGRPEPLRPGIQEGNACEFIVWVVMGASGWLASMVCGPCPRAS